MATRYDDQDGLPYSKKSKQQYLSDMGDKRFIERSAIVQACLQIDPDRARFLIEAPHSDYYDQAESPWHNSHDSIYQWGDPYHRTGRFVLADHRGEPDEGIIIMKRNRQRLIGRTVAFSIKWNDREFHPRMQYGDLDAYPESVRMGLVGQPMERIIDHPTVIGKGLIIEKVWPAISRRHGRWVGNCGTPVPVLRIKVESHLFSLNEAYAEIENLYS